MRRRVLNLACVIGITFAATSCSNPDVSASDGKNDITPTHVAAIAMDAYIYGYPLVTMDMTRRVMTNVAAPEGTHAPIGQFANLRAYPTAAFKDITAPNADTLYSAAWLDLSQEPYIFSIPNSKGRYYLMPMLDAWTTVFQVPGKRTTGGKAQAYVLTGPHWTGALPVGIEEYKSPTDIVWILGRTYCTGTPEDYHLVHVFQNNLSLVPLSAYGKPYTPPDGKVDPGIDMKSAVRDQVNALDVETYFNRMTSLMTKNPPTRADRPMLDRMAMIGIVPGQPFEVDKSNPELAEALQAVPKAAIERIMGHLKAGSVPVNGWVSSLKTGVYGTYYLQRAMVTAIGLGANRPQDAVYPISQEGVDGQPYDAARSRYLMHFEKDQLPPVNGFWSLTMYTDQMFFVQNALNRYTVSDRNKFEFNPDGSLDLYLQKDPPGKDKQANWLPAPDGRFIPMLRLYWPKQTNPSILDGTWKPPEVRKVQ